MHILTLTFEDINNIICSLKRAPNYLRKIKKMVGHLSLVVLLTDMCAMLFWKITESAIWNFSIWSSSSCTVLLHCLNIQNQLKMFENSKSIKDV